MANPITRLIRFVFDRTSANKAERESKSSLQRIGSQFDTLKKRALALAGTLVAAFSVRALFNFGKESVRVATEATGIWGRLEQAVENAGVSFASVRGEIDATARAMQDATAVGDEDFAAILAELITTSNDYEGSLRNVSVVADLAAAKNMDLRSAAQLVGRAMVGQTSTLTRYGIVIKEGQDAMEVLRRQFGGFAEAEGATFEGLIARLRNELGDFRQAIGDVLIEGGRGTGILQTLIATFKAWTETINANRSEIALWGNVVFATIKAGGQTFVFLGRIVKNSFEAVAGGLAMLANDLSQTWARTINFILEGVDRIPGVDIEFRMNELTPEEFATQQRLLSEGIEENAKNMGDALFDLGQAYRDVGTAAREAAAGQIAAASVPSPRRDTGGGGGVSIPEVSFRVAPDVESLQEGVDRAISVFEQLRMSAPNAIMADLLREMEFAENMTLLTGEAYASLQTEADLLTGAMQRLLDQGLDPTDSRLQALAGRLREVQKEQALVTKQHEIMAGVATATGEILNAAFGAGIGQLAAGKAKQNAIMAAEQAAMGLVASLNPFTAPKAAGHFSAAAQFAGIAAAWGALAGATGGFSGGGGGGGIVGTGGSRNEAGRRATSVSEAAPELNVYLVGEGFDAVNPRVQRVVQGALREAQASTGPNARVRIFRTSSMNREG